MLKLYNTLTRRIEEFTPINPPSVGFYSCGPTVYDYAHIGHARTYVFADILQRTLIYAGYSVKRVMNITDVGHLTSDADIGEDKMEKGAKREGKSVWDIARYYTYDFMVMMQKLNITKPQIICKATDYITSMIAIISTLEEKGFTYRNADGVYFDTSKLKDYGKLTGQTYNELIKGLKAGARIEMVVGKKHPTDFALWKLTPKRVKRQMEWDSPWGKGFPGWHIECSAMSMEFLGETFDLHTGGVDHIPIHHTNEIAQSEASTGKQFVRFWLHGEHLLINGEKMSKSLGNFYRLTDVEKKGFSPLALRYLFLTASYRQQLNFTWKALVGAQTALTNLYGRIQELINLCKHNARTVLSKEKLSQVDAFRTSFKQAIYNDLNTSQALSVVWSVIKNNISAQDKLDLIDSFDEVLGLGLNKQTLLIDKGLLPDQKRPLPEEISFLVQKRDDLRLVKKWEEADELRKEIEKSGFILKDTPQGSIVIRK